MSRPRPLVLALVVLALGAAARAALAHSVVLVPLHFQEALGPGERGVRRVQEPVTFGIPLPDDTLVTEAGQLVLIGPRVAQFRTLERWPNGKVKWALVDTLVDLAPGEVKRTYHLSTGRTRALPPLARDAGAAIEIDTGAARFRVGKAPFRVLDAATVGGREMLTPGASPGIVLEGASDWHVEIEENGPVRAAIVARGARATVRIHFYRGKARARIVVDLAEGAKGELRLAGAAPRETVVAGGDFDRENTIRAPLAPPRTECAIEFPGERRDPNEVAFALRHPVIGKARDADWVNQSGALRWKIVSAEKEAAFARERGWRPSEPAPPELPPEEPYDPALVDLLSFLRREDAGCGAGWLRATRHVERGQASGEALRLLSLLTGDPGTLPAAAPPQADLEREWYEGGAAARGAFERVVRAAVAALGPRADPSHLRYGYLLSGDKNFLMLGERGLAARRRDRPDQQALLHLLLNHAKIPPADPLEAAADHDRTFVWYDLPVEVEERGGAHALSWIVPRGARRVWIRAGAPFWEGADVAEIPAAEPGREQSFRVEPGRARPPFLARVESDDPRTADLARRAARPAWKTFVPALGAAIVLAALLLAGRRSRAVLLVCAGTAFLAGCPGEKKGTDPSSPAPVRTATTDGGSFEVTVRPAPDPIPLNEHFSLEIEVRPAPADASIEADADMPEHRHGMTTHPEVRPLGGGRYEARGFLFHMPGRWEISVDVVRGGKKERATFAVEVR